MGPRRTPGVCEIIGIRNTLPPQRRAFEYLIRDPVSLAISDGFVLGVELKPQLLLHIARTGPAHQRLDRARLFRLVIQHPFLGLPRARLHCGAGRLVNPRGQFSPFNRATKNLDRAEARRRMVGAAGFEPATCSSVGSRQLTLPPDIEILVQALPRSVARAATSAPDPVIGSHRCQVVDT